MRELKLLAGILLTIAVVVSSIRQFPELFANNDGSAYHESYIASTIGFMCLILALGIWLIREGVKSEQDRDKD